MRKSASFYFFKRKPIARKDRHSREMLEGDSGLPPRQWPPAYR